MDPNNLLASSSRVLGFYTVFGDLPTSSLLIFSGTVYITINSFWVLFPLPSALFFSFLFFSFLFFSFLFFSFLFSSLLFVCFVSFFLFPFFLSFLFWFFRDRVSLYLLEPILELVLVDQLAWNSQTSACLCLLSAGIKGVCHHCLAPSAVFKLAFFAQHII